MPKESSVQKNIIDRLRQIPNSYWQKYHSTGYGTNGVPDIVGQVQGISFWFEVKVGKNKPSELQQVQLEKINASGSCARVVYGWIDAYKEIDRWLESFGKRCDFVKSRI